MCVELYGFCPWEAAFGVCRALCGFGIYGLLHIGFLQRKSNWYRERRVCMLDLFYAVQITYEL